MSVAVQDSLLDFGDEPRPTALRPERVPLTHGAWIDVQRGWLTGSAALFGRLVDGVPWKAERRRMYDRTVDVPRLLCFYGEETPARPGARRVPRRAQRALPGGAGRGFHHGRAVLLPGRPGQRRLARRHDRAWLDRGHHGRDRVSGRGAPAAA